MFSEIGGFTVIPFGYENTIPELAQYHNLILPKVVKNFNKMPDFVLIKSDKTEAYLVEVKYRAKIDTEEISKLALQSLESWDPSHLFVATNDNFYYSPCNRILINNGSINRLENYLVPQQTQNKYIEILNSFIK